ncbi:hypothetical protein I9W82_004693 [Candida metapsilosis]|uniref:Uncharacterized protein n=1 Tax=Candida metapsilosis TaxID=273372 RepID=A0A8H7ZCS9_9ASCO|nr:hypothetical protein I9W82_004693 [Candida metapsilosis]
MSRENKANCGAEFTLSSLMSGVHNFLTNSTHRDRFELCFLVALAYFCYRTFKTTVKMLGLDEERCSCRSGSPCDHCELKKFKTELKKFKTEFKELRTEFKELRTDFEELRNQLMKYIQLPSTTQSS